MDELADRQLLEGFLRDDPRPHPAGCGRQILPAVSPACYFG
ncbi:MAG: hypothetical protein ACYCWW_17955 [Deltaproteobacteria bacterium]